MAQRSRKPANGGGSAEDEVHRKFREALERKSNAARGNDVPGSQQGGNSGVGPATNDMTKRQFRRKSGG